jgi:hypothetical protein
MSVVLNWLMALVFLFLLLQGPVVSLLFSKFVRLQYRSHRESWVRDGMPTGPLFYPPETRKWRGLLVRRSSWRASNKRFWAWLFDTPPWIRRDGQASRLLSWLRVTMLACLAVFFASVFFLIVVAT